MGISKDTRALTIWNFSQEDVGKDDALNDEEITMAILTANVNIAEVFEHIDDNNDGVLTAEELMKGMRDVNLEIGKARVLKYVASMDMDGNRSVDYREFLRKLSSVQLGDITRRRGELSDLEDKIKNKLREQYDDAKQGRNSFI